MQAKQNLLAKGELGLFVCVCLCVDLCVSVCGFMCVCVYIYVCECVWFCVCLCMSFILFLACEMKSVYSLKQKLQKKLGRRSNFNFSYLAFTVNVL